jgi:hypothetical protein
MITKAAETTQTYEQKQEERSIFTPAPEKSGSVDKKPLEQANRLNLEQLKNQK